MANDIKPKGVSHSATKTDVGHSPTHQGNSSLAAQNQTQDEQKAKSPTQAVAGKAPQTGTTLGMAYFTSVSIGRYDNNRIRVDASSVSTSTATAKAAELRAEQAALAGTYNPTNIIKNTGIEAKASFYEAIGAYSNKPITLTLTQSTGNLLTSGGGALAGRAEGALGSGSDFGTQTAGGFVTAGVAGYAGFKTAQTSSSLVINAVKNLPTAVGKTKDTMMKVGKGTWDVVDTMGKATVTVTRTAGILHGAMASVTPKQVQTLLFQEANNTGLLHTATSHSIINGVKKVRNGVSKLKTGVVATGEAAKHTFSVIREMPTGAIVQQTVTAAEIMALKGAKIGTAGVVHFGAKGAVFTFHKGLPKIPKMTSGISLEIAGMLSNSNDMMLQGVGNGVMLSNYGIRTSVVAGRLAGRVVKTSVVGVGKFGKGTWNAASLVREKGLRAAWNRARNKTASAVMNAGKSVVSALVDFAKAVGRKIIVPILLIAILFSAFNGIFAAPVVAIGGIFSGLFDTNNGDGTFSEHDIRTYISDPSFGLPAMRTKYINDLYNTMNSNVEANGGVYDFVRFKTNDSDEILMCSSNGLSISGISDVFYTEEELENIIQPIFNAVLLKDFQLSPTDEQAKATLQKLFNKLFRLDQVATVEYCGQSHFDGSGTYHVHSCGSIHALDDCPNVITGTHSSYTCPDCCYYWYDDDGDAHFACSGYRYCGGHDVLTFTLNMDGLYELLYTYFEQPIDQLASVTNRTDEQERQLQELKDYYDICQEYINQVSQLYCGSLKKEDLSGVNWVNGSRTGNQAVIDTALTQVGNVGGKPYWSWYGFHSRVEWCACFVSWCMNQTGHDEVKYSSCSRGVSYFQSAGRFAAGGYTDIVAGDVIFFDWQGDGKPDHTGLVIGSDGKYVYTVEGNSGDTCRTKKYLLSSSVVFGYGLMNY
ncbi:hypothetical protein OBV_p-00370 (plasmid) [Oscillibacter valericigenes Sjm18-20]|nr:hypothetical protein OBV_p-00370 [Oscillibacter valericigenes Sjm18-20]